MKPVRKPSAMMRAAAAMLLLVSGAMAVYAASAVLGGIDIVGSERGLAVTLSADAPFAMAVEQKAVSGKNGIFAVVSIHCSRAIYGLDEFSFTEFPLQCPVRRIAVSESPASGSIDVVAYMTIAPEKQLQSKQKGNKWIILLSREPAAVFSWNTTPSVAAAKPAASTVPDNGQSRLTDVTMLTRDRVERLTFRFDRATVMRLKHEEDRVVVLFVNATSDLPPQRLTPPGTHVSSIELRQVAHGGTMWLGASILMKKASTTGILLQAFSDRLVMYCPTDSQQRLSMWSAKAGPVMSYAFAKLPQFEVDYKSMEEKARTDLASTVNGSSTFAIREEQPKNAVPIPAPETDAEKPSGSPALAWQKEQISPAVQPAAVRKEPSVIRFIIAKNNVNLRIGPSASDSILCRLSLGTVATGIAKQGTWVKVSAAIATGWVTMAMVVDSGSAPKELLDKVEQARARQLEKTAALEKAAQSKALKEKLLEEQQAQKQLQQQKLLEEQQANKAAALAAREAQEKRAAQQTAQKELAAKAAAARDSTLRYNAAVQDSVEKAKRYHGPRLVEYHVFGRDPFLPLSRDSDSPVPTVEDLNLVGILYDQADRIGLFEDRQDKSRAYALRENDPVQNGYVLRVQPDKVLFLINELGISRTYALKLTKEKQ